ncbi:hypothetical protein L2E82_50221 [Cichorium intybus]|nr:hypothetical protein L2E82_50221 [Cichorium intybus]
MAETKPDVSLKDQGNEFFKAGNYLKAAAIYTQAIKKDPSNPTLYRKSWGFSLSGLHCEYDFNRAAAFLNLVKLQKALTDAETTISLNPNWEKLRSLLHLHGYFRKGCVLEAMERYDDFERRRLTENDVREVIYREILEYHPQMFQEYLHGEEHISFMYPSGIDRFKPQFADLEEQEAKEGRNSPLRRQYPSIKYLLHWFLQTLMFTYFIWISNVQNVI